MGEVPVGLGLARPSWTESQAPPSISAQGLGTPPDLTPLLLWVLLLLSETPHYPRVQQWGNRGTHPRPQPQPSLALLPHSFWRFHWVCGWGIV